MEATNKRIIKVSLPIILGNLTQMMLGIIDSAMVGSISAILLAASALVNNILAIPFIMGMGLTFAISPLVASANGNKSYKSCAHIGFNGFVLVTLFAILIAVGLDWGSSIVYHLDQDPEVAAASEDYLVIMAWSSLPMLMFLALKQIADGLEFTRTAMMLSLLSIPINTFLNYILIFGKFGMPEYGLYGAGLGTLISRIIIFVALLWILLKAPRFQKYRTDLSSSLTLEVHRLKELLRIGIPSSLQYAMESGAFAVSGIMIGWFGAVQQAAHQIAIGIASLTFMVSMGLSAAGSILVGNALGRGKVNDVRTIGKKTLIMGLFYGILCAVLFALTKDYLPYLFNNEVEVVAWASVLLVLAGVFQIPDAIQAIDIGLLRGLHDVRIPTIWISVAYWVIGIPFGYYLAFYQGMESSGIWYGLVIGLSVLSITLTVRFFKVSRHSPVME